MFISYSQNFEDVMLWRALKHIEHGFYLDIGAQDPVVDSVSRGFYEIGWRGVHIEPTYEYATKLRENRPDETVFQNAVGDAGGIIRFFEFAETGLSTGDATVAAQHEARGFQCRETNVELISLETLFERYKGEQIHWMKIDVEGMEGAVLASWGKSPSRPWIVVIESTEPLSADRAEASWQNSLTDRDYELCYFDGLNCYFVSKEHSDLCSAFSSPPNVFDDFSLSGTATSRISFLMSSRLAETQGQLAETQGQLAETQAQISEKQQQLDQQAVEQATALAREVALRQALADSLRQANHLHDKILSLHRSFSWRVTAPYRVLSKAVKGGPRLWSQLRALLKQGLGYIFFQILRFIQGNPQLYNLVRRLINRHPSVRMLTSRVLQISRGQPIVPAQMISMSIAQTGGIEVSDEELATLSRVGRIQASQIGIR